MYNTGYADGAGNTTEDNSSVFSVISDSVVEWLGRWTCDSVIASSIPTAVASTGMGDHLRGCKQPQYFTKPATPT